MTSEQMSRMYRKAQERHGFIDKCGAAESWDKCFTVEDGNVVFWFNTEDGSTHVITEPYELETYQDMGMRETRFGEKFVG